VTLLDEVEQVRANLFGAEFLGGSVEVLGEIGDTLGVSLDRPRGTVAESQVVDHTAAKRCHGKLIFGEGASSGDTILNFLRVPGTPYLI